jgi:RNA polymerase sigma-70 factor (ECF subfamily)
MRWRDRRLLAGLLDGDPRARGRLMEEIYPRLFSYLCYLSGDHDRAADLAQETAIRMWRALPDFDFRGVPSLLAWGHRVAHSAYVDSLRARKEPPAAGIEAADLAAPGADPADQAVAQAHCDDALAAVGRLPAIYRQVIVLRFLQGLAYREVAGVLDIPPGTVRSRLAKALELLRRDLSRTEGSHEL